MRKYVSVMEMANEIDVETAGDDAEEIWVLGTELFPYENIGDESGGKSFNEMEGKEPMSDPFHYSEWDYQIQLERPAWATVLEKRAKSGDLQVIDDITAKYKREIHRMKFLLDAMQPQGVQRIRKLEDGDEIDINAAIASFIDIRLGNQPDPRIMMRIVRKTRDFSILVLLDLSESTNEKVQDQEYSVLRTHPAGLRAAGRRDQQGGRSVRDPRLLLGRPPRRRVLPLQGFRPALGRGAEGQARRHDRPAVDPHGRGDPPRRPSSEAAALGEEAAHRHHRRRAGRHRRARSAVPALRHQEGGGGSRRATASRPTA